MSRYKNSLVILSVVVGMTAPAFSEDIKLVQKSLTVQPTWAEFCEIGYERANVNENKDFLNIFSFVKAARVKQTYWANRRQDFEKYLNYCVELDEMNRPACYSELRIQEQGKNDLYNQKRKLLLYENNIKIEKPMR